MVIVISWTRLSLKGTSPSLAVSKYLCITMLFLMYLKLPINFLSIKGLQDNGMAIIKSQSESY